MYAEFNRHSRSYAFIGVALQNYIIDPENVVRRAALHDDNDCNIK